MPKALSATVPEALEARARAIAKSENRSLSNVVENALGVFTALPKELRDEFVERLAEGGPDDPDLREAVRQLRFALARRRWEQARDAVVASLRKQPAQPLPDWDDLDSWEVVEETSSP